MPRKILVIEDNPDHLQLASMALRSGGAEIVPAASAETAMNMLKNWQGRPVDLILLDIRLQGMDGFDFLAWIKGQPSLSEIPVVVVTTSSLPAERNRALELGAIEVLTKPLPLMELHPLLQNLLAGGSSPGVSR
ncbi:MAG: putative cyclic di-GMP phosphodiesterase [Myxococcota bacterium]|nr:putative cyclic di-GMP phosphodiesterase [Myxococcota bacterium]